MEDVLKEIGLSRNESRIYLALVKMGSSTATQIIKKTNLHRANVYDTLEKLHEKGLVSSISKINIKHYQAASPNKILSIIKEKEQRIQEILPKLEKEYESSKSKEEIQVFKGKKGLKTVLEDILNENKTWFVFGGAGKLSRVLEYYIPQWNKRREKQRLNIKIIYDEKLRDKKQELKCIEKRYVKSKHTFPAGVGIYANKVVQFIFGNEPLIIVIMSETARKGFMEYFNLLWKTAKK
ncbi:MAG: helix-turn-helix domain-containing protein [Candidatus Woesearchaeota archaeon]